MQDFPQPDHDLNDDRSAQTSTLAQRIDELIRRGEARNLHSVIALVRGKLLFEWYGSGPDFKWAQPLGVVAFDRNTLHDIRSVTKSIVALVYGIALKQGKVPDPNDRLMPRFPQYPDLVDDPRLAGLTVRHALTMTLGLEWNEDAPYNSLENSEIAMEYAADRYRYILEQPVVAEPGSVWRYCGGASALLGYLIERGTGRSLADFAREALFEPLGIEAFEWMAGRDGVPSAASGLRLRPRDLATIGQVVMNRGQWQGREIIPSAWLDDVMKPHVTVAPGFHYGYQWYIGSLSVDGPTERRRLNWYGGIGNGFQRLWLIPELDSVFVMTAGNYDDWSDRAMPERILETVVTTVVDHDK